MTVANTVSVNYLGNPANLPAEIPEDQSCSLWIVNLPGDVTIKELLSCMRGYGRIFATVINPLDKHLGHGNAAAQIIFFELRAAQAMFQDSKTYPGSFVIRGMVPSIYMNRIRTPESTLPIFHSRVLVIRGPKGLVNKECLTAFFERSGIAWEMESIITYGNTTPGHVTQVWKFGSYRGQAIATFHRLRRSKLHVGAGVKVDFGIDPCWLPIPGVGMYRW